MNGIVCVYKPTGYTSFDIIAIMRKLFNTKKIGHSGTLDPMAEGVLPVFVGAATKAVDFCPITDKEYRAGFKFGVTTDTQDISGTVLSEAKASVSRESLDNTIKKFVGEIEQIPPMYSAVKVNGRKLCDLARKGLEIERKPRKITVHSIEIEGYDPAQSEGVIKVSCSKGTYIRTLIHDIGLELGCGAVMTSLLRTRSNGFTLKDGYTLEKLREIYARNPDELANVLLPFDELFKDEPKVFLDEVQTRLFRNGAVLDADLVRSETFPIEADALGVPLTNSTYRGGGLKNHTGMGERTCNNGIYTVYDSDNNIAALAKIEQSALLIIQRFRNSNT